MPVGFLVGGKRPPDRFGGQPGRDMTVSVDIPGIVVIDKVVLEERKEGSDNAERQQPRDEIPSVIWRCVGGGHLGRSVLVAQGPSGTE